MSQTLISREDKDKDKDKYIYGGKPPEAPAPKAHIYTQPPSLEEIESYCRERGNQVDPEHFYHYYPSNGWRVERRKRSPLAKKGGSQ